MQAVNCAGGRRALAFGRQKINLHRAGCEFAPRARRPTPSSADLCFITPTPLAGVISCLRAEDVAVEDGPCGPDRGPRAGHVGLIPRSNGNLIEVSNYD